MIENPIILTIEIVLAMGLLIFLFFRKKHKDTLKNEGQCRIELRLSGGQMLPNEVTLHAGHPAQLIIARLDTEPREELFEIQELDLYELLPALNATIIPINPVKRGRFPIVIGTDRTVGFLVVE